VVPVALALVLMYYNFLGDVGSFNSDHLFCSAFCQDILAGRQLRGWHLPAAPYLFPDIALNLLCQPLSPNLVAEFFSYTFIFFGLMLAVLAWMGRVLGLPPRRAFLTAAAGVTLLLAVHLHPAYHGRVMLMGRAGNHIGAILIGLLLVTLTSRSVRRGWSLGSLAAFLSTGALTAASDKLLIVQFLAPLALALRQLRALFRRWRGRSASLVPDHSDSAVLLVTLTFLFYPFCNILALFVAGLGLNPAVDRYTLPGYLLPFLASALLLHLLPGRKGWLAGSLVQLFGFFWLAWQAAGIFPTWDPKRFEVPYPPLAQALDRLAEERGPMRGLAGFWSARFLTFLTRHQVPVLPLTEGGTPYFHASNPARFLADDAADLTVPRYNFLVLRPKHFPKPSPRQMEELYGKPAEKILVESDEIWLYEHIDSPKLNLFLQARLAERARRQVPYAIALKPLPLTRPKANLTPGGAKGVLHLAPRQPLEVQFAGRVSGPMIDFAAEAEDRFRLELYWGDQLQGVMDVPEVRWTGATYGPPGIQARLLPVPARAQAHGWDRAVIVPLRPDAGAGVAHLLLYMQELPGGADGARVQNQWQPPLEAAYQDPLRWK
jgi:hypothetical protein